MTFHLLHVHIIAILVYIALSTIMMKIKKILLHVGALEIRSVRQRIPVSAKLILKK